MESNKKQSKGRPKGNPTNKMINYTIIILLAMNITILVSLVPFYKWRNILITKNWKK